MSEMTKRRPQARLCGQSLHVNLSHYTVSGGLRENGRKSGFILQSCLAIAEQRFDDNDGPQYKRFIERLAASIIHDRNVSTPDYFGYNGDNSDNAFLRDLQRTTIVTYNGVEP